MSTANWPMRLQELFQAIVVALEKDGVSEQDANRHAVTAVKTTSDLFGGMQIYLPYGKSFDNAIRDMQIFRDFDGANVLQLARKYRLTHVRIYGIIEKQRELSRAHRKTDCDV